MNHSLTRRHFFVAAMLAFAFGGLSVTASAAPDQEATAKALAVPVKLSVPLDDKLSMEFVLIPAGKFMMGSPETDKLSYLDEYPQHEVTLTKAFYIGVYEVTQEQYDAIMGRDDSPTKGPTHPVEKVPWLDCLEFCRKLSQQTGCAVRLPTEAEWEYACRAGTTTRWSFGDDESKLDDYAWTRENSGHHSHPVGQKKPNPWGLYDMHGNVNEWCQDRRAIVDHYKSGPVTDPQPVAGDTQRGGMRLMRGGSWMYPGQMSRSTARGFEAGGSRAPSDWYSSYGFRVVMELKETK